MTHATDVRPLSTAPPLLTFNCDVEVPPDTVLGVAADGVFSAVYGLLRHCRWDGSSYVIEVTLIEQARQPAVKVSPESQNYYEFLQISPTAQAGTIHRVFRYLAGLYHPDNPHTGDSELFLLLNRAYSVLSNAELRAAYDAELNRTRYEPRPTFAGVDFMDGVEGELNRRLAVLAVLYRKCRSNINDGHVKLVELETEMGFPREYLDFTTWYLRSKKYITKEDNSDFALTATGVDFVEENYAKIPLLGKFISGGSPPAGWNPGVRDTSSQSRDPVILPIEEHPSDVQLSPSPEVETEH